MMRDRLNVTRPAPHQAGHRPSPAIPLVQQAAGNRAIQRLLSSAVAQPAEETLSSGFLSGKGNGQPLGESVRGFMEERFGHGFGSVRVHTDAHAARSAREISAVAYTAGSDIFFAPGQYRPDSHEGRHLLAHELTHVLQQGGSPVSAQAQLTLGATDDSHERDADRVADAVMALGEAAAVAAYRNLPSGQE